MSCGCNSSPCQCGNVQPEKVRLVRNVNAACKQNDCGCKAKSCTRIDWLLGLGCCGFDVSDCQVVTEQGAIARLCVEYRDSAGNLVDPVEPRITITDPYNKLFLSSQTLTQEDTGKYFFLLGTDANTKLGKWTAITTGIIAGITVRTEFFFCIVSLGTIPEQVPDEYGYGYGDTYGYGDNGITAGADGYGTFAGREECGFDGNVSKDIPATGGCRTNRNEIGDGFWDGISYEEACVTPIGKRGQCVVGDTIVDSINGGVAIKDVKVGDTLRVFDKESGTFSFQRVTKTYTNRTKAGQLYKVSTQRGRQIACTSQHPFIVQDTPAYINAEDLKIGERLLVEPLASQYSPIQYQAYNVINETLVRQKLKEIYGEQQIEAAVNELKSKNLCVLDSNNPFALTLARLVGHMFGDGGLSRYFNTNGKHRLGCCFTSGSEEEISSVSKDVCVLGFNMGKIQVKQSNSDIAQGISRKIDCRQASLCELLYVLGAPLGDKALTPTEIPQWIQDNKNYLREFLAALYGSEGFSCITSKNTLNYLCLTFNKVNSLKKEALIYANQLIQAFAQFGIPMVLKKVKGTTRKSGEKTTQYRIMRKGEINKRSASRRALFSFCEQIGIRYSPQKEQGFRLMYEYQKYIQQNISERQCLHSQAIELRGQMSLMSIAQKLGTKRSTIDSWFYRPRSEVGSSSDTQSFGSWCQENVVDGNIYDSITNIEHYSSNEDVYDVTMETIFDFVTNGIVTHDCMKDRAVAMTRVKLKDIVPECMTGDTIVTTQLGHKKIDEVKSGDNLLVYYDKTKEYSFEPVREVIMNKTKTGEIVTITTKRGRKLRCTREHPLIGFGGEWIDAEDLQIGTKIAVNPLATSKTIRFDAEEVFFTYDQFKKRFPKTRQSTREQIKKWFPIKGPIAVIFARLAGFMFGDGHLTKRLDRANFASDCIEELKALKKDLGFLDVDGVCEIVRKQQVVTAKSVVEKRNQEQYSGVSTYFEVVSAGFAKVLSLLGVPSGDKAVQTYSIPDWIMDNKWLLKNFLSAYYGADGCDVINSTGTRELNFSFNKDKNIDVTNFIDQWKQAFAQFDIPLRHREETGSGAIRKKDKRVTTKWVLVPECSKAEATIKFAEQIGCCYHSVKAHNLAVVAEYQREAETIRQQNEQERQRVFQCLRDGLSRMQIVDELNPNVNKKERRALWTKYDKWIRGDKEAIEMVIANVERWNAAQQTIYSYVMKQPTTRSYGEVARDIIKRFKKEFNVCGMTTNYRSVWVLVKKWKNGRIPDSQRYDHSFKDSVREKNRKSKKAGVDFDKISFKQWQKEYVVENRYFDRVASIEINESNENVYDCKFDAKYMFAETMISGDCWAYTEDEIDMYLEASLADFNIHPTFTSFTWDTLPEIALGIIAMGAQVWALAAQGLLEAGREFQITDAGIAFHPPAISGYMQTAYSTILQHYTEFRDKVKGNIKPAPNAIGTFRVLSLLPTLARLRHLRAKQII